MRTQRPDERLVERFNGLCSIPSDRDWPSDATVIDIPDPLPGFHDTLTPHHIEADGPVIVRITHPHRVLDADPDIWTAAADVSPFRSCKPWDGRRPLRIAVHVRRGDVHLLDRSRLLPNSYYIGVMQSLTALLDQRQVPYELELHSETSDGDFTVSEGGFGTYRTSSDVIFKTTDDAFDDFRIIKPLQYRFNEETVQSFCRIATADIIVTSISCFSYLAAILNRNSIAIYHPFFHAPLDRWLIAAPDGTFDVARLQTLLGKPRSGWSSIADRMGLWRKR